MSKGNTKKKAGADNEKSRLPIIISGGVVFVLVASYLLFPEFRQSCNEGLKILISGDQQKISNWVQQFGIWGPVAIIVGLIVQMFLFVVPTIILMIVSILAYGPWLGSLYALVGITLASITAYAIGWGAGHSFLNKLLGRQTKEKLIRYVDKYGAWLVAIARVNPVLSNDTVSFISGIVHLNFWKFIIATVLATIPLLALISYLGENEKRLKNGMLWISGIALVLGIVYFIYDRTRQKS